MFSEAKEAAFSSFNDAFSRRLPMMKMQASIWGGEKKEGAGNGKAAAGSHTESISASRQEGGASVSNAGGKLLNRVMSMGSESASGAANDAHKFGEDHKAGNNNVHGPGGNNMRFVHANTMPAASEGTRNANLSRSISNISAMSATSKASFSTKGMHWMDDSAVSKCFECNMTFHMFNRKHHCRACGRIFCDKCSQRRAYIDGTHQRVCDHCYQRRALHDASTPSPSSVPNLSNSHSPGLGPATSPRQTPGLNTYTAPSSLTAISAHVHPLSNQNAHSRSAVNHGQIAFGRTASLQGDDRRDDADERTNNFSESAGDRPQGGDSMREYYYEDDDNFRQTVQNDADVKREHDESQLEAEQEGQESRAAHRDGYACYLSALCVFVCGYFSVVCMSDVVHEGQDSRADRCGGYACYLSAFCL